MATNPMEQFNVNRIGPEIKFGSLDLSFTNASLFMLISATVIYIFLFFGTRERKIIPSKVQLIAELFYNFVAKIDRRIDFLIEQTQNTWKNNSRNPKTIKENRPNSYPQSRGL